MIKKWIGIEYDSNSSWPTEEDFKKLEERIKEQCEKGSEYKPIIISPENLKTYQEAMEILKKKD